MYERNLVIGKFYPPHKGHLHLIKEAARQTEGLLTVLVLGNRFESFTVNQRTNWIEAEVAKFDRSEIPARVRVVGMPNDCPEDYNSDEIWFAQIELMRYALRNSGVYGDLDKVFSSEEYGQELADHFNAQHVLVDLNREEFHISGTACRDNLDENWKMIIKPARRELATRIVVVGAESTGTTTLTEALTKHYRKQFPSIRDVPEYGRTFTETWLNSLQAINPEATMDDLDWSPSDFSVIAKVQSDMEESAAMSSPLVIADTDALATGIWHSRYCSTEKIPFYAIERRDLYLITDHQGVDFHDDGYRDGEHLRAEMTESFKEVLTERGYSWVLVTGDHERRMKTATSVIDQIIQQNTSFTSPDWARKTVLS
jgi:NadR type nicotinamide-nucleotide adenylyltransferase